MNRREAIAAVMGALPQDAVIVASNGHVSREVYAVEDRPGAFYMIGSMGLAPSIALGIAESRPDAHVVVIDGDGNVLMNMGSLAQTAARGPARFTHVCIDNGRHASTGGQRTISDQVDLTAVARASGYAWAETGDDLAAAGRLTREAVGVTGPAFVRLRVSPGGLPEGTPRVEIPPEDMAERVRVFLG